MAGKWLEMLTQITPRIERVAVLFNPATAPFTGLMRTIEDAAPILAVAARAAMAAICRNTVCGPTLPSPMTSRMRDCGASRSVNGDRM